MYTLSKTERGYSFDTDSGLHYTITIARPPLDESMPKNVVCFDFYPCEEHQKELSKGKRYDKICGKVSVTICEAIRQIFQQDQTIIMVIICDESLFLRSGAARLRLFSSWSCRYPDSQISFSPWAIKNKDQFEAYGAIMFDASIHDQNALIPALTGGLSSMLSDTDPKSVVCLNN